MQSIPQAVRHAFRAMVRRPGLYALLVVTLSLSIGASVTVFRLFYGVSLRPLPFREPDSLVQIWATAPMRGDLEISVSPINVEDWRRQAECFESITTYGYRACSYSDGERVERFDVAMVSGNYFATLGIMPRWGRVVADDQRSGSEDDTVLLKETVHRRLFGDQEGVVGQTIWLDERPHRVIGVIADQLAYPEWADAWKTATFPRPDESRGHRFLFALGRFRDGVSIEEVQEQMDIIASRLEKEHPGANAGYGVRLVPLRSQIAGPRGKSLAMLLGAVLLLMLIGCANVGALLTARVLERSHEWAIHTALGARGRDLAGLMVTEAAVVGGIGGLLGTGLAVVGTPVLLHLIPFTLPRVGRTDLPSGVLLFSLGLTLVVSLTVSLVPVLQQRGTRSTNSLRGSHHLTTGSRGRRRLRKGLVIGEIALTIMLLSGAVLLIRSYLNTTSKSPGFASEGLLTARVSLPSERYSDPEQRRQFFGGVLQRIQQHPNVMEAEVIDDLPFSGSRSSTSLQIEGFPADPDRNIVADRRVVTPGYFDVMQLDLLEGRLFTSTDDASSVPVAVVNEAFVQRFVPNGQILGRRFRTGSPVERQIFGEAPWWEIIGVVEDILHEDLRAHPVPEIYRPLAQLPSTRAYLVLRGRESIPPAGIITSAVHDMDSYLPVYDIQAMNQRLSGSIETPRFQAMLLGLFAAGALLLAGIGVFGVVAGTVRDRTHEIGVRLSLGATHLDVLRLVMGESMALVLSGSLLGAIGTALSVGLLKASLFGVSLTSVSTYVAVGICMLLVAVLATVSPANAALRLEATEVLKQR